MWGLFLANYAGGSLWNDTMLLLAGLMGVLAIGATALVWFETAPRSDADQEVEVASDENRDSESQVEVDSKDPVDAPADVAPAMAPSHKILEMDDPFTGGGWLDDDDDDFLADDGVTPPGFAGMVNETPVVFEAVSADVPDEAQRGAEEAHHALMQAHQESVTDFIPEQDRLIIVFDDTVDPDPQPGLERDEAGGSCSYVTLNGVRIAMVDATDGLTVDHITLVPESSLHRPAVARSESAAA